MAKPKNDPTTEWFRSTVDRMEKRKAESPVVDERWWVVDYYPIVRYSDEYENGWTQAKEEIASPYFNSLEDAEKFIEEHLPESGAELKIRHQNKRRITKEEWVNW